jgi:hypothetical protein
MPPNAPAPPCSALLDSSCNLLGAGACSERRRASVRSPPEPRGKGRVQPAACGTREVMHHAQCSAVHGQACRPCCCRRRPAHHPRERLRLSRPPAALPRQRRREPRGRQREGAFLAARAAPAGPAAPRSGRRRCPRWQQTPRTPPAQWRSPARACRTRPPRRRKGAPPPRRCCGSGPGRYRPSRPGRGGGADPQSGAGGGQPTPYSYAAVGHWQA